MLTGAPKGTKDMLPVEGYKWRYIEKVFADVCSRYGFKEIRTPMFEHTELFVRGVGDTTDIVQKEMYTWTQAKRSITLKPEGTAPAMRSFIEHKGYADPQPTKYYYNTPCFRYEKPQSGRLRQFHQFGTEIFGAKGMMADVEAISLAYDFLQELGIKDVELEINSVGCPHCRKEHRAALKEFLAPNYEKLCGTCKDRYERNPLRIIDCKSPDCQALVEGAPAMVDYLCDECKEDFAKLQEYLDAAGIQYIVNPGIVRGLDYYTKTAFEFITNTIGAQGTVCGGGRYDHLCEELGGPEVPGVGFGMGKERLLLVMEANGIEIPEEDGADALIAFMGDAPKKAAIKLARELRAEGLKIEIDCLERNFKGQFKLADRTGARHTIVIGESELETGKVAVKTMATSEQVEVPFEISAIVEAIK
ncbi:MAG: histidine--tRNA ligase [Eubacterium sp.]|nr:histidine--tRNA ligase [Eubacterium sp.]